jgi:hypothetical protein
VERFPEADEILSTTFGIDGRGYCESPCLTNFCCLFEPGRCALDRCRLATPCAADDEPSSRLPGAATMAARVLTPGQGLHPCEMPPCSPPVGAVMCRQHQPEHVLWPSCTHGSARASLASLHDPNCSLAPNTSERHPSSTRSEERRGVIPSAAHLCGSRLPWSANGESRADGRMA